MLVLRGWYGMTIAIRKKIGVSTRGARDRDTSARDCQGHLHISNFITSGSLRFVDRSLYVSNPDP